MSPAAPSPLIYRSVALYETLMRCLHGRGYEERYRAVAEAVPAGAEVVELCAGHGRLYTACLREKGARYLGLDASETFVRHAARRGVPMRRHDLLSEPIPPAEVVILHASLYQFMDQAAGLLRRMIDAASARVVVAEPVRNLSSSAFPPLAGLARRLTRTSAVASDPRPGSARFDETALRRLFADFPEWEEARTRLHGREMIAVFRGGRPA